MPKAKMKNDPWRKLLKDAIELGAPFTDRRAGPPDPSELGAADQQKLAERKATLRRQLYEIWLALEAEIGAEIDHSARIHIVFCGERLIERIVCHADDMADAFRLVDDVAQTLTDGVRRLVGIPAVFPSKEA